MGKNDKLIRKITSSSMLAALSYVSVLVFHFLSIAFIPGVNFLTYDPKDILLCISGFALGPLYAIAITIIVSFIEMITISATGIYGFIMNVIASLAFVLPASLIYKYNKNLKGAILSLVVGFISNIIVMSLWNIIITPIYMSIERSILINNFLWPIILFNIIKTGFNVAFTLILYKPVVGALRTLKLMNESESKSTSKTTITIVYIGLILLVILVLITYIINKQ